MSKHTPGPWEWNASRNAIIHKVPDTSDEIQYYGGLLVCESVWDEPNARLIAAAPTRLSALEFIDTWVSNPVSSYSVAALDGLFLMTRDRLRVAIAAAKGEP